jgi:hypothetical protein
MVEWLKWYSACLASMRPQVERERKEGRKERRKKETSI